MPFADLNYWKGHHVLAFRNDWYIPAVIYGAENATGRVFVELKTGHGIVSVYDDVFNRGYWHIISDITPPFEDVMANVKVAVRVPSYEENPHGFFAPGFVCAVIAQSGRFLVRLYGGQEHFVGVDDIRFMIPPWSPYSTYYLQQSVSYNKPDFFQAQYAMMQNPYYNHALYPFQESTPQLPAYSEPSKAISPMGLSANNFSGGQFIEKENFKTEPTDYYGTNHTYVHSPPDQSVSSSDPLNLNSTYEENLSFIFNPGENEAAKKNEEVNSEVQHGTECIDQNYLNQVPETVKNVVTSLENSLNSIKNIEVPKRKYNKRKNVDPMLPSTVPGEQKKSRGRKTKAFLTFSKDYRESVAASSFDKSEKHISQKLADIWNLLPEDQRKRYQEKAKNEVKKQQRLRLSRLSTNAENYKKLQPLTIQTNFTIPINTQRSVKTEAPLSCSDDSPRLVIDESRFENFEDNESPLFIPKKSSYPEVESVLNQKQNQMFNSYNEQLDARNEVFSGNFGAPSPFTGENFECFPGSAASFLKLEEIKNEEIKSTSQIECDTTTNFGDFEYSNDLLPAKPKTLIGEKFFPPNFSADEIDNDITFLTEKVTRELFGTETKRLSTNTKAKYSLIVQFFKDHGYFPHDYAIDELLNQHPDIFRDKRRLKNNIREVRQKLLSKKEPSFLPLSPLLRDILDSVMGNPSPLNTPE